MEDRFGSVNILVVDDMPVNIELLKALLEPRGYHVNGAASGADALKIIDKSVPDLILLDVMMPEMNGFETCRRVREKKSCPKFQLSSSPPVNWINRMPSKASIRVEMIISASPSKRLN